MIKKSGIEKLHLYIFNRFIYIVVNYAKDKSGLNILNKG